LMGSGVVRGVWVSSGFPQSPGKPKFLRVTDVIIHRLSSVGTHRSGMICIRVSKSTGLKIPVKMFRDTSFRDNSSRHHIISYKHGTKIINRRQRFLLLIEFGPLLRLLAKTCTKPLSATQREEVAISARM
jgi:hypothetical protein